MRLVAKTGPGTVDISYMWLPTFLGLNSHLMEILQTKVGPLLIGKELTDAVLDEAHEQVINVICEMHPLPGLREYLDALKFVEG